MRQVILFVSSKFRQRTFKVLICVLSVLILVGCSNSNNKISEYENKDNTKVGTEIKKLEPREDEIMKTIKYMGQESSVLGTEGEKKKAEYLKNKMEGYGYSVEFQDFEVFDLGENEKMEMYSPDINKFLNINPINSTKSKGIARNVIGKSKDYDKNKKTLYMFAHYDTTKRTTGVYDNSTGVSAVAEIARVLQNYKYKDFNIVYIFFSAEENNRKGSRYFLSQLSESERRNILGAINIDMVGYTGYLSKDFSGDESEKEKWAEIGNIEIFLNDWVKKDALEIIFNERLNGKYNRGATPGGMSDDISFARLNVPTLYFADKNFMSGFEIEEEDIETQLAPVNPKTISDLVKDISDVVNSFDIHRFNELNNVPNEEKGVYENK